MTQQDYREITIDEISNGLVKKKWQKVTFANIYNNRKKGRPCMALAIQVESVLLMIWVTGGGS